MVSRGDSFKLGVNPSACIFAALALLVIPLNWFLAALIAALFHELCHYSAVRICGGNIRFLRIGSRGAVMDAVDLTPLKMLFCILAGPLGGLCLISLARVLPRVAICAAFQSAYNLLPLESLDGGRALRCCLSMRLPPPLVERLCYCMNLLCRSTVVIVAAWAVVRFSLGVFPLVVAACMLIVTNKGKSSCKDSRFAVQ